MNSVQFHRGPDDGGTWNWESPAGLRAALASRRLAIRDLSPAAHMPMSTRDGKIWIAYNGEVYNASELKGELESAGVRFRSQSDTEVVLELYSRLGPSCLPRLRGIFAFAIIDLRGESPELFLARDPFGVKPLYYSIEGELLLFASELKALRAASANAVVDPHALARFLTFLWVPEPQTVFKGIRKLPAGHYARFHPGRFDLHRYWAPTFPPSDYSPSSRGRNVAAEARDRLFQVVKSQMVSDVPLGAFLSAGLDSSSIVAGMRHATSAPIRTFTVTFPKEYLVGEANLDDAAVAARTASALGTTHREIILRPDVADLLPRLIWHMDEPVADPAIITAYSVCREARRDVTVLLSGVGGDEIFGGYRKYLSGLAAKHYQRLPALLRRGLFEPVAARVPPMTGTPLKGYAHWVKKWAQSASLPPLERFIQDATYMGEDLRRRLSPLCSDEGLFDAHRAAFDDADHAHALHQMMLIDQKVFMPSLNLNYNDKMGMAASTEVRVPFLDHVFADWVAWNIPPSMKVRGLTTKHVLREAMRGVLPEEVLRQPKASFGAPVTYWLEHDLREMTEDILFSRVCRERGWLEPGVMRTLLDQHSARTHDWGLQIWQCITLELWARQFIDAGPRLEPG